MIVEEKIRANIGINLGLLLSFVSIMLITGLHDHQTAGVRGTEYVLRFLGFLLLCKGGYHLVKCKGYGMPVRLLGLIPVIGIGIGFVLRDKLPEIRTTPDPRRSAPQGVELSRPLFRE